jgi:hypothetical protein
MMAGQFARRYECEHFGRTGSADRSPTARPCRPATAFDFRPPRARARGRATEGKCWPKLFVEFYLAGRRTDRARGRTWSGHPRLGRGLCECRGAWMTGTSPVKETSFTCANMPQSSCSGATFQKSTRVWVPAATTAWIERPPLLITMAFSTTSPPPRLIVMKPVQFESTM